MRTPHLSPWLLAAAVTTAGCRAPPVRIEKAVDQPAVVRLYAADEGLRRLVGTGFFVGPDVIVTAHHVVRAAVFGGGGEKKENVGIEALASDGTRLRVVGVRGAAPEHDVIAIVVEPHRAPPEPLALREAPAVVGEPLVLVASALGDPPQATVGRVVTTARSGEPGWEHTFETTLSSASGASGGPVFDRRGQVLGVAIRGGEGAVPGALATSAHLARPLVGVDPTPWEAWRDGLAGSPREYAAHHAGQAGIYLARGDPRSLEVALRRFRRALRAAPDDRAREGPLEGACDCLVGLGRRGEAPVLIKSCAKDRPDWAGAQRLLGLCMLGEGERDAGLSHLRDAVRLDPYDARCASMLGWCLTSYQENEEALTALRRAVVLAPRWAYPWELLGYVARRLGRFEDATDAFGRLASLRPDYADGLVAYAEAAWAAGRADEAEDAARTAVEIDAELVRAHGVLARVHLAAGEDEAYRREVAIVLRLDPTYLLVPTPPAASKPR